MCESIKWQGVLAKVADVEDCFGIWEVEPC